MDIKDHAIARRDHDHGAVEQHRDGVGRWGDGGDHSKRCIFLDHQPLVADPRLCLQILQPRRHRGDVVVLENLVFQTPHAGLFQSTAGEFFRMLMHGAAQGGNHFCFGRFAGLHPFLLGDLDGSDRRFDVIEEPIGRRERGARGGVLQFAHDAIDNLGNSLGIDGVHVLSLAVRDLNFSR